MRLMRITTNYPTYLRQFYGQRPELANQTYQAQYDCLMADCYGWADFWTHALGKLGYEVWEPVGNAEAMQKRWAKEEGVSYGKKTWLTDIVAAQIKKYQPQILFVNDYATYTYSFLTSIRQECPSIKLIMGWCGAPYQDESVFKAYDIVLSNIPTLVNHFQQMGLKSIYMRHAFEPRILDRLNSQTEKKVNFSFLGSINKGNNYHLEREELLKQLIQRTDLQIWADTPQASEKEKVLLPFRQLVYSGIQWLKPIPGLTGILEKTPKVRKLVHLKTPPNLDHYVDQAIASVSKPPLYGLSMFQKLYESEITFNNHIELAVKFASNMRLYEATGVGTCLLTDWQDDLPEIFEPEREVVTYQCIEEAIEKVKYLLSHDGERQAIAYAGQKRTLRDHTFTQRAIIFNDIIKKYI